MNSDYLGEPYFNKETMLKKSQAAGYLTGWMVNIIKYNTIYKKVKPLQDTADAAQAEASKKQEELKVVQDALKVILDKVQELKDQLAAAEAKKKAVEDEAKALQDMLQLANRLVNGLADENKRW